MRFCEYINLYIGGKVLKKGRREREGVLPFIKKILQYPINTD